MYQQTRIFVPLGVPFDTHLWAETAIGGIIAPIVRGELSPQWFWFSRYDCPPEVDSGDCDISQIPAQFMIPQNRHFRSIRFRYSIAEESRQAFEDQCHSRIRDAGCSISDFRNYDFFGDLSGPRHLGGDRTRPRQERRAQLVAELYQAISRLVIDALVGPDPQGRYGVEHNDDPQNPLGSSFESLHHLFCNITNVPLRVLISQMGVRTDWSGLQNVVQEVRVKF